MDNQGNTKNNTPTTTNAIDTNSNATNATVPEIPNANTQSDEEAIRNQKLVEEFQYLLEKSQSLFSGLR